MNLNESCFICNNGVLKIIGDKDKKRHDKNVSDNRLSITVVRCKNAAGNNGPVIFIGSGQMDRLNRLFSGDKLTQNYGLPSGSCVLLNKNAHMNDDMCVEVVRKMAPGIRQMPVIRDLLDWQAFLTFNGFKSHVNVNESLEIWAENKIRVGKEEAGTSHVNQAYNQQQAQADKRMARKLLDTCRSRVKGHINQYQLIAILTVSIKNLPKDVWEKSF